MMVSIKFADYVTLYLISKQKFEEFTLQEK
jgi:hypothetical protein